ncbi:HNH endonuclease [Natrononativus amylolyticus]|uniref:HNH endonuclease n=1 Tax=Natrononativus amylolyticus TaxID=2963434 RepID=UPI0020CEAEB9|nr:HNH endonuclease signature motif containing protein [Natrononativus amylolyticus]
MDLQFGDSYHRRDELAAQGGTWQGGIITSKDNPYVFIITSDRGRSFGYVDEFLADGTFQYSGQGAEGDMDWRFVNRAIRDHEDMGKEIHVFEKTDESYMVRYRGEYQYEDHEWVPLQDKKDNFRDAILFDLVPVGGRTVKVQGDPETKPLEELYADACVAAPLQSTNGGNSGSSDSTGSSGGASSQYNRSEVVKKFARRSADGVCQGCEEAAPFKSKDGKPFLEVHHLKMLGDEGADHPDNVIALCPNCHRRAHEGEDGRQFNKELVEKAKARNTNICASEA